jgi:hypothetical protein
MKSGGDLHNKNDNHRSLPVGAAGTMGAQCAMRRFCSAAWTRSRRSRRSMCDKGTDLVCPRSSRAWMAALTAELALTRLMVPFLEPSPNHTRPDASPPVFSRQQASSTPSLWGASRATRSQRRCSSEMKRRGAVPYQLQWIRVLPWCG